MCSKFLTNLFKHNTKSFLVGESFFKILSSSSIISLVLKLNFEFFTRPTELNFFKSKSSNEV